MKSGRLSKKTLGRFLESECDRQLFLDLGNGRSEWLKPSQKIKKPFRERKGIFLFQLGNDYEEGVYKELLKNNPHYVKQNPDRGDFDADPHLTKDFLENLHTEMIKTGFSEDYCLLEYDFETPEEFIHDLFKSTSIPTAYSKTFRPDILIIGQSKVLDDKSPLMELTAEGEIRKLEETELKKRAGINVIDVKVTNPDNVGIRHFIEIIVYMRVLAFYLKKIGVDDKFFIRADNNGIFPQQKDLGGLIISDIREKIIEQIPIEDYMMLYERVSAKLQEFYNLISIDACEIDDIPFRFKPLCARCNYLADCIFRLQNNGDLDPKNWSIELIPYMSETVLDEIKSISTPKFRILQDIVDNLEDIPDKPIPTSLYSEKSFIIQRAKALLNPRGITPPDEDKEYLSLAIPRYTPISFIINIETDPIHNVVLGAGFSLGLFLFYNKDATEDFEMKKKKQFDCYLKWWEIWKKYFKDIITLDDTIDKIIEEFEVKERDTEKAKRILEYYVPSLKLILDEREDGEWQKLKGHKNTDPNFVYSTLNLYHCYINEGFQKEDEQLITEKIIKLLFAYIIFIQCLECFVSNKNNLYCSIFHWSKEQLDNLEELFERNMDFLLDRPDLRLKLIYIVRWFTPSESDVKNPFQPKKIYNLRFFAETTLGFPLIINYTWHEIASYLSKKNLYKKYFYKEFDFNINYWNHHFNFIDFQQWLRYIYYRLSKKKSEQIKAEPQRSILRKQILGKVETIDKLRYTFQSEFGKNFIAGYIKPKAISDFFKFDFMDEFHRIAHIWYIFENYTKMYVELEADKLRTFYPEYGIGKLESAEVEGVRQILVGQDTYQYTFILKGMSINVKSGEGDWVYLLPKPLKNQPRYVLYAWRVIIESMTWNKDQTYTIITAPIYQKNGAHFLNLYKKNLKPAIKYGPPNLKSRWTEILEILEDRSKIFNEDQAPVYIPGKFYLYPQTSSPWLRKLEDLLSLNPYGTSILGKILASKWDLMKTDIRSEISNEIGKSLPITMSELYMFAPHLLPSHPKVLKKLKIEHYSILDESQEKAIKGAMKNTIYGIQGPPGTGKTKTIADLNLEFIFQKNPDGKNPVRILLTAFSYAALQVAFKEVLEKLNTPSLPTQIKSNFFFVSSQYRDDLTIQGASFEYNVIIKKGDKLEVYEMPDGTIKELENLDEYLKSDNNIIIAANAHQLYNLLEMDLGIKFDLIVADEASQIPVSHFIAPLLFIRDYETKILITENADELNVELLDIENNSINPDILTKVVIVGDQLQMSPVQPVKPPRKLMPVLDNLFGYFCEPSNHNVDNNQLLYNYRSNKDIVLVTNELNIYPDFIKTGEANENNEIQGEIKNIIEWNKGGKEPLIHDTVINYILDPSIHIGITIHDSKFDSTISEVEADILCQIILGFYLMSIPDFSTTSIEDLRKAERIFWTEKLGVVSPHNAQGRLLIRMIYVVMTKNGVNHLIESELMNLLKNTIYSVEKFQGSARDLIVTSVGISSKDKLIAEEEFLYNINRFNVLSSRARSKFIFICSRNFLNYIPKKRELLDNSYKIRHFAYKICEKVETFQLNGLEFCFRYKK